MSQRQRDKAGGFFFGIVFTLIWVLYYVANFT
jgi:hypothetical protein